MKFDENLRNLRKEKDYSQEYLAEKLGVTRQTISKWENGTAMPDLKKLIELADFFEVSMDFLLGMDYGTKENQQEYNNGNTENNSAQIQNANRYTDSLIQKMNQQNHNNMKWLSIVTVIISVVLVITIFTSTSSRNNLISRINGLENTVTYLQNMRTNPSYSSDDEEDYYDVEFDVVKLDSKKPYIINAKLKYAPSSYPKNSTIYYLVPKADGGVERVEAEDNNGEFLANINYDLSTNKPVYFVLDDGENIIKQVVDVTIRDIFGSNSNVELMLSVNQKSNGVYKFENDMGVVFSWENTEYAKITSADLVVLADNKEVYRNALKKSVGAQNAADAYVSYNINGFELKLNTPSEFKVYVEVQMDNGAVCREYPQMAVINDNNDFIVNEEPHIEYVFAVGDKTVTIPDSIYIY